MDSPVSPGVVGGAVSPTEARVGIIGDPFDLVRRQLPHPEPRAALHRRVERQIVGAGAETAGSARRTRGAGAGGRGTGQGG